MDELFLKIVFGARKRFTETRPDAGAARVERTHAAPFLEPLEMDDGDPLGSDLWSEAALVRRGLHSRARAICGPRFAVFRLRHASIRGVLGDVVTAPAA